jgi:hypothetical protein
MAMRDKAEEMLDASRDIIQEILRAQIVKLDAWIEKIKAEMKANHQKMDSCLGKTKASPEMTEACPEVTTASLEEEKEPAPEVPKAVAKTEEVPVGATGEEAIGAAKDRSGNLRLAVRCRRRLKTRTKRDGRLRQDCAATVGRPTHRFVPALRKGGLRKGPGRMCRHSCPAPGKEEWPKIMWNEEPLEDGRARKGGRRAWNATVASGG